MGEKLIIRYDTIGSFLFLEVCDPYAKQESNEIGECVVARFNLVTGEMESVEVLFFDSWLKKEGAIHVPVSAVMWPADTVPPKGVSPSRADATLTIRYDLPDDILALEQRLPHTGQIRREICEEVSARINAATGEIESLEIQRFKARVERDGKIVLPVNATMRPVKHSVAAD